jgi:phosphatidylserine/phosphatidylglycerophosphate/cardiolipin synthase-like enzyme
LKALLALTEVQLRSLAQALATGRVSAPVSLLALSRVIDGATVELANDVSSLLERFGAERAPLALDLMLGSLGSGQDREPELVWSGPDRSHQTRDTAVVVRELFALARREVLVSGFVVVDGRDIFKALADRMDEMPGLQVRLFLNISRDSVRSDEARLVAFAKDFATRQWPGKRPPAIYYDPRALETSAEQRASLHAKCIVVDRESALVTSANLTPYAQQKNVELGILLRTPSLAARIADQFDGLVQHHHFVRLHDS